MGKRVKSHIGECRTQNCGENAAFAMFEREREIIDMWKESVLS